MKFFKFSSVEKQHLIRAWAAISLAFAIVLAGGLFVKEFPDLLLVSAITVGTGFLFHELAHKYFAQRYGCWAEFRADNNMLFLAILMSFFGFVFAAPGAVMIQGTVTKKRNGVISIAGPATNIVLAAIFLGLKFISNPILAPISRYGLLINAWLAVFNLIPFGNIDGAKVLAWSKTAYFTVLSIGFVFLIIGFL
ncbi:hypothetical protein GOV08_00355 [Candidatus Woesearchaeota archaeon]|nr:hypothetical protein [Candidatus Woesearchaeota archaeon]